jgi:hypothetical protein
VQACTQEQTSAPESDTKRDVSEGAYFLWLQQAINDMHDCDVILYQAGANPFLDDPLGDMLTEEALRQRPTCV